MAGIETTPDSLSLYDLAGALGQPEFTTTSCDVELKGRPSLIHVGFLLGDAGPEDTAAPTAVIATWDSGTARYIETHVVSEGKPADAECSLVATYSDGGSLGRWGCQPGTMHELTYDDRAYARALRGRLQDLRTDRSLTPKEEHASAAAARLATDAAPENTEQLGRHWPGMHLLGALASLGFDAAKQ